MTTIEMIPASVGRASRAWDEQHLDVGSAAALVGAMATGGFTDEVRGAVERFTRAWEGHVRRLANRCEAEADGLRVTMRDWIATDASVHDAFALAPFLRELR